MRLSTRSIVGALLLFLGVAPAVLAQDSSLTDMAAELPTCILQCFINDLLGPDPACNVTDMDCLCTSKKLAGNVATCSMANCTMADSLKAANVSASVCHYESQNRQSEAEAVFSVLMVLSILFVVIRLYVRLFVQTDSHLGIDDWITVFNLVVWCGYSFSVLFGAVPEGLGKDDWDLTVENVEMLSLYSYVGQIIYHIINASVKLALLFFYLRIFPDKHIRYLLIGTVVFITMYAIAFAFASILLCLPVDYFWRQWTDDDYQGTCIDYLMPSYVYAGLGIFLDLWIMGVLLSQLTKLKMNWKKKVSVGLMFSAGLIIVIVSIARFITILNFSFSSGFATSWTSAQIYTAVEVNVGIMCTCFPAVRLLLVHFSPKLQGTTVATSGHHYHYDKKASSAGGSRNMNTTEGSSSYHRKMGNETVVTTASSSAATSGGGPKSHFSHYGQGKGMVDGGSGAAVNDDEIELSPLPTSPSRTRTHESTDTILLPIHSPSSLMTATITNTTLGSPEGSGSPEVPHVIRWQTHDTGRRPVSREDFI